MNQKTKKSRVVDLKFNSMYVSGLYNKTFSDSGSIYDKNLFLF